VAAQGRHPAFGAGPLQDRPEAGRKTVDRHSAGSAGRRSLPAGIPRQEPGNEKEKRRRLYTDDTDVRR
jgi:hypothetical protein